MKLSSQEEYGLRCVLHLARKSVAGLEEGDGSTAASYLKVSEIAEAEGMSEQYVGKLFRILARANLVESVLGRRGGYRLSGPPESFSVGETLAALGGQMYHSDTCDRFTGNKNFCVHTGDCSIPSLWSGLQFLIDSILSQTTLRDLVVNEKTMGEWIRQHLLSLAEVAQSDSTDMASLIPSGPLIPRSEIEYLAEGKTCKESSPATRGSRARAPGSGE